VLRGRGLEIVDAAGADKRLQTGYSPFAPTSHLPGASTSPPPLRNELVPPLRAQLQGNGFCCEATFAADLSPAPEDWRGTPD
jgi:hypothetical protein